MHFVNRSYPLIHNKVIIDKIVSLNSNTCDRYLDKFYEYFSLLNNSTIGFSPHIGLAETGK